VPSDRGVERVARCRSCTKARASSSSSSGCIRPSSHRMGSTGA
jgi:hypothetical protein